LSLGNYVLYRLELYLFIVFFISLGQVSNGLGLLRSLLGLGFGLGDSCDDKPLFWADFKPLSSR
jgi:hypothetical protein